MDSRNLLYCEDHIWVPVESNLQNALNLQKVADKLGTEIVSLECADSDLNEFDGLLLKLPNDWPEVEKLRKQRNMLLFLCDISNQQQLNVENRRAYLGCRKLFAYRESNYLPGFEIQEGRIDRMSKSIRLYELNIIQTVELINSKLIALSGEFLTTKDFLDAVESIVKEEEKDKFLDIVSRVFINVGGETMFYLKEEYCEKLLMLSHKESPTIRDNKICYFLPRE